MVVLDRAIFQIVEYFDYSQFTCISDLGRRSSYFYYTISIFDSALELFKNRKKKTQTKKSQTDKQEIPVRDEMCNFANFAFYPGNNDRF